jgi:hypothetical protein
MMSLSSYRSASPKTKTFLSTKTISAMKVFITLEESADFEINFTNSPEELEKFTATPTVTALIRKSSL